MLHGELDVASIAILVDCFIGIAFVIDEVVLDFSELDFIDGCGLSTIAATAQQVAAYGGLVSIRSPRPEIQRLLELVDFKRSWPSSHERLHETTEGFGARHGA
jgi:anti-anti-sigma factor